MIWLSKKKEVTSNCMAFVNWHIHSNDIVSYVLRHQNTILISMLTSLWGKRYVKHNMWVKHVKNKSKYKQQRCDNSYGCCKNYVRYGNIPCSWKTFIIDSQHFRNKQQVAYKIFFICDKLFKTRLWVSEFRLPLTLYYAECALIT